MRFWDSSAIIPLFIAQAASHPVRQLLERDPATLVWALTDIEVRSGIARLVREGALARRDADLAIDQLDSFWDRAAIVSGIDAVRARAKRALWMHPLRAADALQLAAALSATRDDPARTEFVCLDERLRDAAAREGFHVVP